MVKFAWSSDKRQGEGRLLKFAQEKEVTGIAEQFHHKPIAVDGSMDAIASLRKGMKFEPPRKISNKASWVDNSTESSRKNLRTRSRLRERSRSSVGHLTGLGITTSSTSISSSGQKRIRDEGSTPRSDAMK